MTDIHWQPPTVASTIRTYAARSVVGDRRSAFRITLGAIGVAALILAFPSIDSYAYSPAYGVLGLLVGTANAAWREHQFGGPRRLEIAAASTTLVVFLVFLALIAIGSALFGPAAGSSPVESLLNSLPPLDGVSLLLALAILLLIRYFWIDRPALRRQRAAFRAQVEAERAARAAAFGV